MNRAPPKLDAVFFSSAMGREPVREWLIALARWKEWKDAEDQ